MENEQKVLATTDLTEQFLAAFAELGKNEQIANSGDETRKALEKLIVARLEKNGDLSPFLNHSSEFIRNHSVERAYHYCVQQNAPEKADTLFDSAVKRGQIDASFVAYLIAPSRADNPEKFFELLKKIEPDIHRQIYVNEHVLFALPREWQVKISELLTANANKLAGDSKDSALRELSFLLVRSSQFREKAFEVAKSINLTRDRDSALKRIIESISNPVKDTEFAKEVFKSLLSTEKQMHRNKKGQLTKEPYGDADITELVFRFRIPEVSEQWLTYLKELGYKIPDEMFDLNTQKVFSSLLAANSEARGFWAFLEKFLSHSEDKFYTDYEREKLMRIDKNLRNAGLKRLADQIFPKYLFSDKELVVYYSGIGEGKKADDLLAKLSAEERISTIAKLQAS